VDPAFAALFDGMKGGIVPYFTVAAYLDPVDQIARIALVFALVLLLASLLLGRHKRSIEIRPPDKPAASKSPPDPLRKAEEASDFARRLKDRARQQIDESTNGNH
jgi:hypothetical protein